MFVRFQRGCWFGAALVAVVAASCGSETQLFYSAETQSNFMASCADTDDPEPLQLDASQDVKDQRRSEENLRQLHIDICECTIAGFEANVPFPRFAEFDQELRSNLEEPLQAASMQELVRCIEQEGSL